MLTGRAQKGNDFNIKSKKKFLQEKLASKGNIKELWKNINQIMEKWCKSAKIGRIKDDEENITNTESIDTQMTSFLCSTAEGCASTKPPF